MLPWTEGVYSIPPERVVGNSLELGYEVVNGKPVGIERFIGSRPTLVVGNFDGDYQILEWTMAGC